MSKQVLIPSSVVPNFCPKCGNPIVNARRARIVHPKRRKREPFCCAQSKFLGRGTCVWQGWISQNPVSVGIVLWRDPRTLTWHVLVETRGIEPGIGQEAFVAGFVEPGHTCAETAMHELLQEIRISSKVTDWRYVGQDSPETNPMLLLTFFTKVMKNRRMPKLRPDGTETTSARWVPVNQLETHTTLAWPRQIAMVRRALHLVDPEHFSRLPSLLS